MPKKQWQVDVYTSKDQSIPHTFYDETLAALREQIYSWLVTTHPTYIESQGKFLKEDKRWKPLFTEVDERAYREFSGRGLNIKMGPEYEEQGYVDGKFQVENVRKTLKHDQTDVVNQMLNRGWHILAMEKGEETGRTWYVLGHVEQGAF